jgi:hypothetical protein
MIADMCALPQKRMTVDEFLAWAEEQPERHDIYAATHD